MPVSPRHACPVYPCSNLVPTGQVFCEEHYQPRPRRGYDTNRPSAAKRGYDRAWYKMRGHFLKQNPVCEVCGDKATEVDHVIALAEGGPNDDSNFSALCHSCHSRKTVRENGGFGNKRRPRNNPEEE